MISLKIRALGVIYMNIGIITQIYQFTMKTHGIFNLISTILNVVVCEFRTNCILLGSYAAGVRKPAQKYICTFMRRVNCVPGEKGSA